MVGALRNHVSQKHQNIHYSYSFTLPQLILLYLIMVDTDEPEILIGTYEDYVVGYQILTISGASKKKAKLSNGSGENNKTTDSELSYSFEQSFAIRGHSGSVRALAASSNGCLALSAGFDEMINLFGLRKRKLLQTCEGAFNCVTFVGNSHVIGGSIDGNIYIYEYKSSTLALVKTLKGHKAAVSSLGVHPSEKVLLSLSKDNSMRTWNLIKGRCAYVTNIKTQAHLIQWSKSGDEFMIAANNEVYLYNNSGVLEHSIKLGKRVNSVEFITRDVFIVASDSGRLEFFDLKKGTSMMRFEAHEVRIKSIKSVELGDSEKSCLFVTASSDGIIKLWSTSEPGRDEPQKLAEVDTGTRLTCMTSAVHSNR